jgi:hypothetical protein
VFSVERLIVVFFPFSKYKCINNKNKSVLVTLLFILSFAIYGFVPFANGLELTEHEYDDGSEKVTTLQCQWIRWLDMLDNFILAETLLTIFVPFVIIFLINTLISFKLTMQLIADRRLKPIANETADAAATVTATTCLNNREPAQLDDIPITDHTNRRQSESTRRFSRFNASIQQSALTRRKHTYLRTSRNLIFILTIFLLLNTPMVYSNMCALLVKWFPISRLDNFIAFFSRDLFYLNFSINFFLYAFDRSQLKWKKLACFRCCR